MSEENAPKQEKNQIHQPEINKGLDAEKSIYEKLSYQERGNLREGYQPIIDMGTGSIPPDGGSGVPDKKDD